MPQWEILPDAPKWEIVDEAQPVGAPVVDAARRLVRGAWEGQIKPAGLSVINAVSALGQRAIEEGRRANDSRLAGNASGMVRHTLEAGPLLVPRMAAETATEVLRGSLDERRQAHEAQQQGQTGAMIQHSVAAVPLVGPMLADPIARAREGDYAGAVGSAAGAALVAGAPSLITKGLDARTNPARVAAKRKLTWAKQDQMAIQALGAKDPVRMAESLRRGRPHIEAAMTDKIETPAQLVATVDDALKSIRANQSDVVKALPADRIKVPLASIQSKLLSETPKAPQVAARSMQTLAKTYPQLWGDLSLVEGDAILHDLNAAMAKTLEESRYNVARVRRTNPLFAAREALAKSIRDEMYGHLERRGVPGVRELRRDEGALMSIRNAAWKKMAAGDAKVAGTGPTLATKAAGALAEHGAVVSGEAAGVAMGLPTGVGAFVGNLVGNKARAIIAPGGMTRNSLIARAFHTRVAEAPRRLTVPTRGPMRALPPAAIPLGAAPDPSFARGVPAGADVQYPSRRALPPPQVVIPPVPRDTSGPIPPVLPEAYQSYAKTGVADLPLNEILRPRPSHRRTPTHPKPQTTQKGSR